jgi:diaminopimelate decarboxylase
MSNTFFLPTDKVRAIREAFGTPTYVYDQKTLEANADAVLNFPNAFGLTARYAMKALPAAAIVRIFADKGLWIDASSGYEAERAIRAGVKPDRVQLTAQQAPENLRELIEQGVWFTACSLSQLDLYGSMFPGTEVTVRINPGLGSGHNNRTNVGGPSSAFGIWHGHLGEVLALKDKHNLRITRMHTHIGSGGDPEVWDRCARLSLDIAAKLPDVNRLSLGGGYKVGRMPDEYTTDLQAIGEPVVRDFKAFAKDPGRRLHLEVEPGTYLVANAGILLCDVMDIIDTGEGGYHFIKVDSGMTELLRPSMYGAQHPMELVGDGHRDGTRQYLVVGHCCESGDLLTPEPGNPEGLAPRELPIAHIGDTFVIGGAGAYASAMSAKNYNSFPECAEVLIQTDGTPKLIRKRQTLDQILENEI